MAQTTGRTPKGIQAENAAVAVAVSGLTDLLYLPTAGLDEISIEVVVTANALDQFEVHGQVHPNGSYYALYSASGDFTTPVGLLIGTSGDLTAQAAGTTGWLIMNVAPLYAVLIKASAAAGIATVTARSTGKARG